MNRSIGLGAVLLGVMAGTSRQEVFRSAVHAVTLDVAVSDSGRTVSGLTLADFVVRDNGVVQSLTVVGRDSLPIDLILLVDISASSYKPPRGVRYVNRLDEGLLTTLDDAVAQVLGSLRSGDRLLPFTFATTVRLVTLPFNVATPNRLLTKDRGARTALLDAIGVVLMRPGEPNRRRIVVVVTDARDTASVLDHETLVSIADHSDATVHILGLEALENTAGTTGSGRPRWLDGHTGALETLTARTGGYFFKLSVSQPFGPMLRAVLDESRLRYLISYTPQGVELAGWHETTVSLKNKRGDVRARRGYWGPN